MKRFMSRKVAVVGIAVGLTLGLSGAAFAYFTSIGSGSGSATVGVSTGIVLSSPSVGPLYPGAVATSVTVTINNPGTATERVGTISGVVTTQGGCLGSWFTVASISYNASVAGGLSPTAPTTVALTEAGVNQDACQNQTMAIVWSSN